MQQPFDAASLILTGGRFEVLLRNADHLRPETLHRASTALLAAKVREKPVPGNATQPTAEILTTTKIAKIPPGRDEHLLRQVIRLRHVVELSGQITAQHQFMPPDHMQIQIGLTAFDAVKKCVEISFVGAHIAYVLSSCGACWLSP